MLKNYKNRLRKAALVLSAAMLLSSVSGLVNKAHAAKKQQQARQQQAQRTSLFGIDVEEYKRQMEEYRLQSEIEILCKYLNLNIEFFKREHKGLDTKEVCIKRKSLEEKVEKILNRQLNGMLVEMYPLQNKQYEYEMDIGIDIIDTPSFMVITDRGGKLLYQKNFSKAFSRSTLSKLEDLAEFLGPDVIMTWKDKFGEMPDGEVIKKVDKLIGQAKKDNNGKLERKYRAFANYTGGYILPWDHKIRISSRECGLSDIVLICGHEYGHILHRGFPVSMKYKGEQKTLQETICDLLGDETSSRYAQKYLQKDQKRYKRYMLGLARREVGANMWKGLIKKVDKLIAEGEIDKAEWVMNEVASIHGITEINQASLAIAKLYYNNKGEKEEEGNRSKLDSMLEELSPDYFVEVTKYVTNFNEVDYARRLMKNINELENNELKQSYLENQETIKELKEKEWEQLARFNPYLLMMKQNMADSGTYFIPRTLELRKEFIKKSILEHELYERLPEKELAKVIKNK